MIIEDVIKGRPVPQWPQSVTPIKAFIYSEVSMLHVIRYKLVLDITIIPGQDYNCDAPIDMKRGASTNLMSGSLPQLPHLKSL